MEKYHHLFLAVHIAAGSIALLLAPVAMIVKKGGPAHRRWGRIYFWSMAVVAATAIIMSIYHHIPFLLMVAVFSFYNAFAGYRALYNKKISSWRDIKLIDWIGTLLNGLFAMILLAYATRSYLLGEKQLAVIAGVFGGIGLLGFVRALFSYYRPSNNPKEWLRQHIGGMLGSYIAAVTAFAVNTMHFLPPVTTWIGPTIIGVPLMILFQRRYLGKKKAV